jgi:radical SAM superfamily enzyme YgiQ (UPF0313 family)
MEELIELKEGNTDQQKQFLVNPNRDVDIDVSAESVEDEGYNVSLEMGCGGVKEHHNVPWELVNHEPEIDENTDLVLFTPDMGKRKEKDEYFVPNLHNGLFRIQAFMHDKGVNSALVCTDIYNMESAFERIAKHKPALIALSPYFDSMRQDLKNIDYMRKISPDSIIIIGGFEASLNPQWTMMDGLVDIIIRGEGEYTLQYLLKQYDKFKEYNGHPKKKEFLAYLRTVVGEDKRILAENKRKREQMKLDIQKKALVQIGSESDSDVSPISEASKKIEDDPEYKAHMEEQKELVYKPVDGINIIKQDGTITVEYVSQRIPDHAYQDISMTAFYKLLDTSPIYKYWKLSRNMFGGNKDTFFRFVSSDHCPYKCTFCQSSIFFSTTMGKKYSPVRYVESENIIKILERVQEVYPFIKGTYVDDENFVINKKRAIDTLNMIIEARGSGRLKKDMMYFCRTRTDNIDPEIAALLSKAGFKCVSFGSESYSKVELDKMKKNIAPERNLAAVKESLNAGLAVAENYILYTPITTPDTFFESATQIIKNLSSLEIDGAATLFITPLPGTVDWGDGDFQIVEDFPWKEELFKGKVLFRSKSTGNEYIGTRVIVPNSDRILPHPEITLVRDPIMREASLRAVANLPQVTRDLRKKAGGINLARNFVTLANIASAARELYKLTGEQRWYDMYEDISNVMRDAKEDRMVVEH